MKAVILAGGFGTRISEESHLKPKPMIEIGGKPILWHILKIFGLHNINEFVICCGYKGYIIKEYFANYFLHMSDVTIDMTTNNIIVHEKKTEDWKITLVDTGENTQTGGRIKRIKDYINSTFCLTYGDGVSDINLTKLIKFHQEEQTMATVTAIQPAGRFGSLDVSGTKVRRFVEKPLGDNKWVSGGFFVCEPTVFDLIADDKTIWEGEPLESMASKQELSVYRHTGFWGSMDTARDKDYLNRLWYQGNPPWKGWE